MSVFKVTLKNYRCFEDSQPLTLEVGSGFTALVGPNNSGKSTFLKSFHELRQLFGSLNAQTLYSLVHGGAVGANYAGVEDPFEIFHDDNSRPITIELEFPPATPTTASLVRLTCTRASPSNWHGELWYGQPRTKLTPGIAILDADTLRREGDGLAIDVKPVIESALLMADSLYIGAFRNAISEGGGSYYDLAIGISFIDQWNSWKTGTTRNQNLAVQALERDIAHIFGYDRLEINATVGGQRTLQVIVNEKPYRLRELGAGLAQFLVVFGNVAIRRPAWLLIDEPELNLHPSLQTDFLMSLTSYAKQGVMFATHSIGLARSVADRLYAFQKPERRAVARPFEQTPNFAEFVGEMSYSSFKELGYESILLVEGVTEVKAMQQFLRALGKDHKVVVIPLGGRQLIRAGVQVELAELKRLSDSVAVLVDSERTTAGAPLTPEREAFVRDCQTLGFSVSVTDRRAFENYLSERAVQQVKGPNSHALGPYEVNTGWPKSENWRIARAMTAAEISVTDVGRFLQALR